MAKSQIVVAYGGISPERDISIQSGKHVARAAQASGLSVTELQIEDAQTINAVTSRAIVLPIMHGAYGEDGTIQAQLEQNDIQFLGSSSKVSQRCFDKLLSRKVLERNGLPMANGRGVSKKQYLESEFMNIPHVLKVARGGSSIGTYIVRDPRALKHDRIDKVFSLDEEAVVEELIIGTEVTVPILGNEALPVIEIHPPKNREFDYENKYNGKTKELCPAPSLRKAEQARLQELALLAHNALGCRHLSRVDIMVANNGEPFILEVNNMPGLTENSLYPKSALVAGMDMSQLVKTFIDMVEEQ